MKVAQLCRTVCDPMDYTIHGILQARILEWVAFPFSRGSSQPRDQTQVSHTAGGFFTSWTTGKPKNTGLGNPSLLQQIFPTQESNLGLPHCRRTLYQLSYQGPSVGTRLNKMEFPCRGNGYKATKNKEGLYTLTWKDSHDLAGHEKSKSQNSMYKLFILLKLHINLYSYIEA